MGAIAFGDDDGEGVAHGFLHGQPACTGEDEKVGGGEVGDEFRTVFSPGEFGLGVDLGREGLKFLARGTIPDKDEAGLDFGGEVGAGVEEQVEAFADLEASDKENREGIGGSGAMRGWGSRPRGDGVGGGENAFGGEEVEGAVFVRAGFTVGDQAIQLGEETGAVPREDACEEGMGGGRTQPPPEDGPVPGFHPTEGARGAEVARVRFNDQSGGVGFFEPGKEALLPAEVEGVTGVEEGTVVGGSETGVGEFGGGGDGFDGLGHTCKQCQPAGDVLGEQVEEGGAVGGEDALLEGDQGCHCATTYSFQARASWVGMGG